MKTKILLVTLIAITVLTVTCGCASKDQNNFSSGSNDGLEGNIFDWVTIPDPDDTQATIELAVELYKNANKLDKEAKYRKISTYGLIDAVLTCERYIFNVKNDEEWYYSEAQYSGNAIVDALSGGAFLDLKYGTLSMGKAVHNHYTKGISVDKTTGIPTADVSDYQTSSEELPIFHSSQQGDYYQTDFVIEVDTVKSATIEDNKEGGFLTVIIELDADNEKTVKKPLASLRENAKDARYISCTERIEIWYSGHYKYFNAEDHWTGTAGIKIKDAKIDYKTYFSYDKNECDLNGFYQYAQLKSLLEQK